MQNMQTTCCYKILQNNTMKTSETKVSEITRVAQKSFQT